VSVQGKGRARLTDSRGEERTESIGKTIRTNWREFKGLGRRGRKRKFKRRRVCRHQNTGFTGDFEGN